MSTMTNGIPAPADPPAAEAAPPSPRKLKILMLHGYTQSGSLFHGKTRSLEKLLIKSFPAAPLPSTTTTSSKPSKAPKPVLGTLPSYPGGIQLFYPTAHMRLQPADIPGYNVEGDTSESEAYGWYKRETGGGLYIGLEEGLDVIAKYVAEEMGGMVDGVIGFSQGGCMAAFVASLLESSREKSFSSESSSSDTFNYPSSWLSLRQNVQASGGLKFAVSYSGFYTPHPAYAGFYSPKIETRFLHFIGSLDSVVEEERSMGLVERCVESKRQLVMHPGGHFVPVNKEMGGILVGFLKDCLKEDKEVEESVEDMDVPF